MCYTCAQSSVSESFLCINKWTAIVSLTVVQCKCYVWMLHMGYLHVTIIQHWLCLQWWSFTVLKRFKIPWHCGNDLQVVLFDSHEAVRICRFLFSMLHTMKLSHLKSVLINGTFIPITCICRKESRNLPRECYPVPLLIHSPAGLQDLVSTGQDTAEVI